MTDLAQRLLTAEDVQRQWFTNPDGSPVVSVRWILEHMPRVQLSRRVVRFRADDIELALAARVRAA